MLSDLFTLVGIVSFEQRYSVDNSYIYCLNEVLSDKQYANQVYSLNNWELHKKKMTKSEKYIVKEAEDELKR